MSKSKKNAKNSSAQNNSTQNCENNMNYAADKKSEHMTDCHDGKAQDKNESNCQ